MTSLLWALLAALLWGIAPIFEKVGLNGVASPMAALFYRCVGVLLGFIILGLFMVKPHEIRSVGIRSALLLITGGFIASFIAQVCFYNGLKLGEVSRVVPISASYPFIAFILGVLLLGESLSPFKVGGAALILLGVWFLKLG